MVVLRLLLTFFVYLDVTLTYHLKILNTHEPHGAAPCLMTCVGTTGRETTSWETVEIDSTLPTALFGDLTNIVRTTVDISECHFIGTPIITTTIDLNSENAKMLTFLGSLVSGSSTVAETSKNSFSVYLHGFQDTNFPLVAAGAGLIMDVHWSAFGYIC